MLTRPLRQNRGDARASYEVRWSLTPTPRTFAERAAFSRNLDWVLAALLAGHCRAVRFRVHTLAEGAIVLLPLLLVSPQFVVDPAAGLGAVHRQQLHIWESRRKDSVKKGNAGTAIYPETTIWPATLTLSCKLDD